MTKTRSSLLLLLFPLQIFAASTRLGNEMPEPQGDGHLFHWRWGLYSRFIQNDMLDVRRNNAEVRKSAFNTILGELTLNFFDRIDLHAGVGTSKMEVDTALSSLYISGVHRNNTVEMSFTSATAWSCGLNAKLLQWQNWYTGVGISYFAHYPKLDYIVDSENSVSHYLNVDAHYYSWLATIGGGYEARISRTFYFRPHMAGIYGPNHLKIDNTTVNLDGLTTVEVSELYTPYMWGYVIGATLIGGKHFSLTAQLARIMYMGFSITGTFPF
ncbi:MAG: hypothetical protein K0U13_04995 [Chlamydiae bacterium]|nr:hypothetical protein [Chlamydiota bacterium]